MCVQRLFDRPLFGKRSLWVRSGSSFAARQELYRGCPCAVPFRLRAVLVCRGLVRGINLLVLVVILHSSDEETGCAQTTRGRRTTSPSNTAMSFAISSTRRLLAGWTSSCKLVGVVGSASPASETKTARCFQTEASQPSVWRTPVASRVPPSGNSTERLSRISC